MIDPVRAWRICVLAAVVGVAGALQAGESHPPAQPVAQRRYAFSYFSRYPYAYFSRYPYSYFPRYPYSYFRRYPFGYYQGGYRYPYNYPYYSYGAASYGLLGSYGAGFGPGFGPAFGGLPPAYGSQPWGGPEVIEPTLPLLDWLADVPLVPVEPEFGMQPRFTPEVAAPAPEGAAVEPPVRTVPGPLLVRPYTGLWLGDRPAERRRLYGPLQNGTD